MKRSLRDIIKEYYQGANMTSDQLARRLNISRQMLYYHLDKRNVEVVIEIEKILNIPIGHISDQVMYENLEAKKAKLNEKRKKQELVVGKTVAKIKVIEQEQKKILDKKQGKLFG